MKARMRFKITGLLCAVLLVQLAHAQPGTYAYARGLKAVDSTAYYRLRIGSDILYKAGAAGIVRVYELKGKDTVEVPYLAARQADAAGEVSMRPLKVINESYVKNKASYYTFIPDTGFTYSSLRFDFAEDDYDKDLSLEGSDDNKHWKTILEKDKVFKFWRSSSDHFTRNTIYFPEQNYQYLRLVLDDGHSPRVHLNSVSKPCDANGGEPYSDELVPFSMSRTEDRRLKKTVLECTFTRAYPVKGLKFNIGHNGAFYKRGIRVFQSVLNVRHQPQWLLLQNNYLVSESYNYIQVFNSYPGEPARTNKLKIEVDNMDDQPLKEIGLEVYTHTETLRLKLEKGARYMLAYGKDKDAAPAYDIAYFEHKIPRHLGEAFAGPEKQLMKAPAQAPAAEPFFKSNAWIWLLMILSILLVGGFAVSLLKQPKAGKTE